MIDQETINTLYPGISQEVEGEQNAQSPGDKKTVNTLPPVDDAVETLYPKADGPQKIGNPYALDEDKDSVENTLYGSTQRVELSSETDLSIIAQSEEEQATLEKNIGYIASTAGASQSDVESLVETCNQHLITGEQYNQGEVMQSLYELHGAELHNKLAAAQDLVKSYPDLHEWLETTGAGNNPQIINQMIKISESPRSQARLQKLNKLKQGIKS